MDSLRLLKSASTKMSLSALFLLPIKTISVTIFGFSVSSVLNPTSNSTSPLSHSSSTQYRSAPSARDLSSRNKLDAAFVVSVVGSLKQAVLRMAGASETVTVEGPFDLFALGTLCPDGAHLHIGLSDKGTCIGGHLCYGNLVYTTAEVVLGNSEHHRFKRLHDEQTGYQDRFIELFNPLK